MTRHSLGMDDKMPFGKYKGTEIEEILEDDPQYLLWLAEEADDSIDFDEEVLDKLSYL